MLGLPYLESGSVQKEGLAPHLRIQSGTSSRRLLYWVKVFSVKRSNIHGLLAILRKATPWGEFLSLS